MAFIVPVVAAVGSAIGSAGSALFGLGEAAAVGGAATTAAASTGGLFGAGGILGTGLSWNTLGLLGSAVSGVASYSAGQQQAEAYKLAATSAIIEGNQKALEYQRQGIQVMNRTMETNATIRARAAAGGIDPFSGSAGQIGDWSFAKGVDEYNWARDNASAAILSGESSAAGYRIAASNAASTGTINAVGSLLMGAARFGGVGGATGVATGSKSLLSPIGPVTPTAFGFARNV